MTQTDNRQQLRQHYRQARRQLTPQQQQQAEVDLLTLLRQQNKLNNGAKVALYLANDGEVGTQAVIHHCWQQQIEVYLPVLHPFAKGHLLFIRYADNTPMQANRYGIAEPQLQCQAVCPVADLSLVLTPLVAFDSDGNRLGMGGGYYDRSLSPLKSREQAPELIGLAHDCQQADALPAQLWDIPLNAIATPTRYIACR